MLKKVSIPRFILCFSTQIICTIPERQRESFSKIEYIISTRIHSISDNFIEPVSERKHFKIEKNTTYLMISASDTTIFDL